MKKLEKYIFKEFGTSFLLIVSILIASLWVLQSLKFITPFLKSSEGLSAFFCLILFTLPDLLVIIAPIGLLISTIILYSRFHADRELSVMFSSGYSVWQIARPTVFFSGGITFFIYMVSIFVLPASFEKIRDVELSLKSSLPSILVQEGVFNSFGDITIYVNQKKGNSIGGIIANIQEHDKNPYTIIAQTGELIIENATPKIFMENGTRQEKDLKTGELSILYFDRTIISLSEENKSATAIRPRKPYELPILELISPRNIGLPHGQKLYAEGYQRLLSPLYSLAFSMIGSCFLLYAPFRRRGQSASIVQAIVAALILESGSLFLMNLGAQTFYGIFYAYFFVIGTIIVCFLALRKKGEN